MIAVLGVGLVAFDSVGQQTRVYFVLDALLEEGPEKKMRYCDCFVERLRIRYHLLRSWLERLAISLDRALAECSADNEEGKVVYKDCKNQAGILETRSFGLVLFDSEPLLV